MTSYWDNPKSLWDQIPQNDAEEASTQQPSAAEQPSTPEQPPASEQLPPQQGRYRGLLSHDSIVIQQSFLYG